MKAVNLLPSDAGRGPGRGGLSVGRLGPMHAVLAVLAILLVYVTVYVLTNNSISNRKAQLASIQAQVTQEQAAISRLTSYTQFQKLAEERAATVKDIAESRFDWHGALSDLSKVMPADTSLQSVVATVAPSSSAAGAAVSSSSVRAAISAPAFELKGCTASQDDVARLISRLRLINDVQRVTLEDSTEASGGAAGGTTASTASTASAPGGPGCPANGPSFDLVVFFQPLPGASTGSTTPGAAPAAPAAQASSTAAQANTTANAQGSTQPVSTGATK